MNPIKYLLKILLLVFLVSFSAYANEEPSKKAVELRMDGLISEAEKCQIKIIDWRNLPEADTIAIDLGRLKTQKSWLEFLQQQFDGSYALESDGSFIKLYLVPKGVDVSFIQEASKYVDTAEDVPKRFEDFQKAKEVVKSDVLKLPKIILLRKFAANEKNKTIFYKRIVNLKQMSEIYEAYSFKVKYFDSINTFAPFERNGLPVKNQMVGFSSFSTFLDYLDNQSEKGKISQYQDKVYFSFNNGTQTIIMLRKAEHGLEISSLVKKSDVPMLEIKLSGDQNNFIIVTKIYSAKGMITLVDDAKPL